MDDTFLTSLLWLKDINHNDTLPTLKIVADALAAQEPSKNFGDNFNLKIDELQERGEISEDEVIELKYGLFSKRNMFDITEGDTNKITHATVCEVQRINFLMQHNEVIEEKEKALSEKEKALEEKNEYERKYNDSHYELIKVKSQKYLTKINRRKKFSNLFGLIVVCIVIYFIVNILTTIIGLLSNTKVLIDIGATAIILVIGGILNLFADKFISNQADKISMLFVNKYIEKIFEEIKYSNEDDATDIISYIKSV